MSATASYAIDAGGTILWTDEGFAALAHSHGLPDLADGCVGRPLADFVAGERPKRLVRSIAQRAHVTDDALELAYRCDGPDTRRFAVLRVAAATGGGTVFTTWFETVEPRPHLPLLDLRLPRGADVVWLCAWCNRLDARGWREAEDAARHVALSDLPRVEHSVCEICELLLTRPAGGPTRSGPHGLP